MTTFTGPDVAQITYKPVIIIEDSKKEEEAVSMKTAGSFGPSDFSGDEIVTIYQYIGDFLTAKGVDLSALKRTDAGFYPNN